MRRVLAAAIVVLSLTGSAGATAASVPAFEHVTVVVFENKEASSVLGNSAAPTFNSYARRHAIGKTWKVYAEGLPSRGFLGAASGRYAKKHNPFAYFRSITSNTDRRRRIVPLPELRSDLRTGTLPDFAFVVPDLCSSMHDRPVADGDSWLRRTIAPLLGLPSSVLFVLFDEGATSVRLGGHTAALAVGTAVRRDVRYGAITGHYGVRTIEDAWALPQLGQSAKARPISGIWKPSETSR